MRMGFMLDKIKEKEADMKNYEKPSISYLAVSSNEDMAAFSKFDSLDGMFEGMAQNGVSSYLWNSGEGYEA